MTVDNLFVKSRGWILRQALVWAIGVLVLFVWGPGAFSAQAGMSSPPLILESGRASYSMGGYLEVLPDRTGRLTIDEIIRPTTGALFMNPGPDTPNLGVLLVPVWVRFTLKNPDDRLQKLLLSFEYPMVNVLSLYLPEEDGRFKEIMAGDSVPQSPEVIPNRYYLMPIKMPPGTEKTFYLRVQANVAMTLPMTLWAERAFLSQHQKLQIMFGIIFGAAVGFVIYFLAMAVKLRNWSCFWFALYIGVFSLLVSIYQGFVQELLQPDLYRWNNPLVMVTVGALYFTGAKFLRTFLNVRRHSRRIDQILAVLQWMGLLFIPVNIVPNHFSALYSLFLVGLGPIFSTTVSMVYWAKGVPNARYFAIGWLLGHIVSVVDLLRIMAVLPYRPFMEFMFPAALVSSLVFFTVAVIQQIYTYQHQANQDSLTGLANRRYFDQMLDTEWQRNMRHQRPISLIMVDVDYFKDINDKRGHVYGDECLVRLAEVLSRFARRPGDLAARYGGEEFAVLLPESDSREATVLAGKIREAVEEEAIPRPVCEIKDVMTVSLGVATMTPFHDSDSGRLVREADAALYRAKNAGRNRVCAHHESLDGNEAGLFPCLAEPVDGFESG